MSWSACLPVLALSLTATAPGSVATAQPSGELPESGWQLGAVSLQPSLLLTTGVDTNILRQPDSGLRDVVSTATTGLGVHVGREALQFEGATIIGYEYFRDYASLRAADQAYAGRVLVSGRKVDLHVEGGWLNVRERFNYELEARVRRTEDRIGAGTKFTFTPRTSLSFDVERAAIVFDDTADTDSAVLADVQQQRRDRLSATATHRLTPLTSLLWEGRSDRTTFAQSPARDARRYRTTLGLSLAPAALVSGGIAVGYQWFEPTVTTLVPRTSGLVANGDLSWRLHDRTSLQFGADRDIEYSYQVELPIYTLTALRLGLSQRIGDRWRLSASVSANRLDYSAQVQTGPDQSSQIDRGAGWASACEYRVSREVRITLAGQDLQRRSATSQRQFHASQLLLSIRYAPGRSRIAGGRP
jgi:hypothetical protein